MLPKTGFFNKAGVEETAQKAFEGVVSGALSSPKGGFLDIFGRFLADPWKPNFVDKTPFTKCGT